LIAIINHFYNRLCHPTVMDLIERLVLEDPSLCRVATPHDAVYHSECCYTFHTPYTTGILVSLQSFIGTVEAMALSGAPTGRTVLFLRITKECLPKADVMDAAPTKLAIGSDGGGFATDEEKYETRTEYSVVVLQKNDQGTSVLAEVPYVVAEDGASFPEAVKRSVHSIIHHVGSAIQQDLSAWQADDEKIPVSKYAATLPFVDNGVTIDPNPTHWICEKTGIADDNLWLNLSDGFIGGGRKNWDVRVVCLFRRALF
jgi:ubiquitin carboxyl-terminal hydrolase 5/13